MTENYCAYSGFYYEDLSSLSSLFILQILKVKAEANVTHPR